MNKELKKIKKMYGEEMMHFCRDNFAIILETPCLLLNILTSNFNPTHELYKDLTEQNKLIDFKNFVLEKITKEKEEIIQIDETPEELMAKAGYDLSECLSEEDIQSFRKYYAKGEELCTFWGDRLTTNRVFFAVKKDVDKIKREDFPNPSRQDLYGTSVISIQFTKDGTNTLSIKNRYNHTVNFPDATFSNNLDNIIPGLTDSFERFYGIKQQYKNDGLDLDGYIRANDGKYYKYNYEIGNIYYCPDNIIIDNFEVKKYPKEKYVILDYFILNLEKKEIKLYDRIQDGFPRTIGKIEKIEIRNTNEGKEILITPSEGEVIVIRLDKLNRIIGYKNNNVKLVSDNFLHCNIRLETIEMNSLESIGTYFLGRNLYLRKLKMNNLKSIHDGFLQDNLSLKDISLPEVKIVEDNFLFDNNELESINMPNLCQVGDCFLYSSRILRTLYLPKLEVAGDCFLRNNANLKNLNLPNLKTVGYAFLNYNPNLKTVKFLNLESTGVDFLNNCNESLIIFIAPKLKVIGGYPNPLDFYENHSNLRKFVVADMEPILALKRQRET